MHNKECNSLKGMMTENSFWNFKEAGTGYFNGKQKAINLTIHISDEEYYSTETEIVDIPTTAGHKTYVMAKPYILEPTYKAVVRLYDPEGVAKFYPELSTIGKVEQAEESEQRELHIGNAQAWLYAEDSVLILWECNLSRDWRETTEEKENPAKDENLRLTWTAFEKFLIRRFPTADKIFTPSWEPLFFKSNRIKTSLSSIPLRNQQRVEPEPYGLGTYPRTFVQPIAKAHRHHKQEGPREQQHN